MGQTVNRCVSKHCEKPNFLKVHNEFGKVTKFETFRSLFSGRCGRFKKCRLMNPWNNTKEGPCASELLLIEFSPNLIGIAVPLYLAAASNLF